MNFTPHEHELKLRQRGKKRAADELTSRNISALLGRVVAIVILIIVVLTVLGNQGFL